MQKPAASLRSVLAIRRLCHCYFFQNCTLKINRTQAHKSDRNPREKSCQFTYQQPAELLHDTKARENNSMKTTQQQNSKYFETVPSYFKQSFKIRTIDPVFFHSFFIAKLFRINFTGETKQGKYITLSRQPFCQRCGNIIKDDSQRNCGPLRKLILLRPLNQHTVANFTTVSVQFIKIS